MENAPKEIQEICLYLDTFLRCERRCAFCVPEAGQTYPTRVHEWYVARGRTVEVRRYVGGDNIDIRLIFKDCRWTIVAFTPKDLLVLELDDPYCFDKLRDWWATKHRKEALT